MCSVHVVNGLVGCILAASAASSVLAAGETVTVDTVEDVVDFGGSQQVGDLPGPDGVVSFREATMAVNDTAGPQTIAFAIPQSEWWLFSNMALLRQEGGAFLLIDDQTTIDFTTQTAFTGDTNPNGGEVGIYGLEPNAMGAGSIFLNGDGCVVKGLDRVMQRGYAVQIKGNDNRVIGCTIDGPLYAAVYITGGFNGPSPTGNVVGGTEPGEGNRLTAGNCGVRIDGPADGNIVIGNFLTGPAAGVQVRSATCCPGNVATNNRIGGPTPAERNVISGAGHYGEEGFPTGVQVSLEEAVGTIVEGNYIGTTADGTVPYPNQKGPGGVNIRNAPGTIVRGNVISGIAVDGVNHAEGQRFGTGVIITGNSSNCAIEGNLIGTDPTSENPVPNHIGASGSFWPGQQNPTGTRIGGPAPGQGNVIAFNETAGVVINATVNNIRISGNSIHDNGGLGIDLAKLGAANVALGVTANDPLDPDNGGNRLQNFPTLASAGSTGSQTTIQGTLNSTANSPFTIEFFSNVSCDASGFGEGAAFLGSTAVTTDASGDASFTATLPTPVAAGSAVTATATGPLGDTSEFSACIAATSETRPAGDADKSGWVDIDDLFMVINAWGDCPASGPCDADMTDDGTVDVDDLFMVINHWT